jgi:Ca2+/H+ antiporter
MDTAEREHRLSPVVSIEQPVHRQQGNGHITIIEPNNGSILSTRRSPNLMPMDPPAPGATTPTEAHARVTGGARLTSAAVRELEAASAAEQGFAGPGIGAGPGVKVVKDNTGHQEPLISIWFALGLLTLVTALAGVTAEFLVSSIDGLTTTSGVSREFVGLILLPVIGNSVEHITAVTVSVKDKLNLSMSIAIGSSIQVSLCILPILVLIAWPLGQPLTLYFDPFET